MRESATFIPVTPSGASLEDLTYLERVSRHRSLQILLQDHSPARSAARRHFLLKTYREIIARYLSAGRIEHPLPVMRRFIPMMESLSQRVDCRVEDFRGLGIHVLVQDGNTFYALCSRDGYVGIRRGGGAWDALGDGLPGVREVAVESGRAQHELFSRTVSDFLLLYRIDPVPGGGTTEFTLGGSAAESAVVMDAMGQPGIIEGVVDGARVEVPLVSRTLVWCRFDAVAPQRVAHVEPARRRARPPAGPARLMAMAAVIIGISGASVWMAQRYIQGDLQTVSRAPDPSPPASEAVVLQESPPRLQPRETVETEHAAAPMEASPIEAVTLSLGWRQSLPRPVTSSPALEGERVFFGCRDGYLYACDAHGGSTLWRYQATDGVGSSPVLAGDAVIAADYAGNVFSVDAESGRERWRRRLPAKVVSTASVAAGEVLVGCLDGNAWCLSLETGRVLWRLETGARVRGSSAQDGERFFVPSYDGHLYAVAGGSGRLLWKYEVGGNVSASPDAGAGRVVIGSETGAVSAIDAASGSRLWRVQTGPVRSRVRVDGERVLVGSGDKNLYCIDLESGRELWRFETGAEVLSRPFVVDGLVFVGSYDRHLYCLDAGSGKELARFATTGAVYSSPVAEDGRIYFGNNEGQFYCLEYDSRRTL